MGSYSELLKTSGVARIIAAQLTARFPSGMLSLAFLLHVEQQTGSYGAAGLVLAATSIGQAVAGPLDEPAHGAFRHASGADRHARHLRDRGRRRSASCRSPSRSTWPSGCVAGLATPPVQPAVRTIYPKMVNSRQLTPLFSLDASAQEIIWVVGPVVTTFVATQIGTVWAILLAAAMMVGGGIWFISSPELGRVRIPRSKRRFGVVLGRPPVMLATIVGFLLIGACAALEAGVVAVFGHDGAEAGIVLAIFSVGSLAGGLFLGHVPIGPWSTARRLFIVFAGMALAAFVMDFWWLSVTLFVAGIGIAPALAVLFAIVSASVKFSDTAEAYGWVGTGQLIGAALGSAVAGFLIDAYTAQGAFFAAAGLALLGMLAAVVGRPWHPDLRGRDASPIPDTEPVPLQPS